MAITLQKKQEILKKFQKSDLDTGSAGVQIALLTARINDLSEHFKTHSKDHHGKRGLIRAVNQRRKLLDYIHRKDPKSYQNLLNTLDIRK